MRLRLHIQKSCKSDEILKYPKIVISICVASSSKGEAWFSPSICVVAYFLRPAIFLHILAVEINRCALIFAFLRLNINSQGVILS